MFETRRSKNVVIFYPSNSKFCAVKKNRQIVIAFLYCFDQTIKIIVVDSIFNIDFFDMHFYIYP